jgi:hypothetical protein
VARRAAIDGDEHSGTLLRQHADRLDVRAVAFRDPVRNVDQGLDAAGGEMLGENRGAAGAVHIVVAEDRHHLATLHRVREAFDGAVHVAQHARVGEKVAQPGGEKGGNVAQADAAAGQHAAEHVRESMRLGDRGGDRLPGRIATVDPGTA